MLGRWAILLMTMLAALASTPAGAAAQSDAAATQAYVRADLNLAQTAGTHLSIGAAAIQGVLHAARTTCPLAAGSSPQNPESTELSNEVIGAMVTAAIHHDLASIRQFVSATSHLRWSNGVLTRMVAAYVGKLRTLASLPQPPLCADVRAWAASGFHMVPAGAVAFQQRFMAVWVGIGELPAALSRYESSEDRSLAQRAARFESKIVEFEAEAAETWREIMNALELNP
jgi:hypothetical protein